MLYWFPHLPPYLLLDDLNLDSYADTMRTQGKDDEDIQTLSLFASVGLRQFDGTPKPPLELWDSYRSNE